MKHPALFFLGLALTLVIETPLVVFLGRKKSTKRRCIAVALLVNLLSFPIVNLVFPLTGIPAPWLLVAAEAFALLFEAGLYFALIRPLSIIDALLLSAAVNLCSFTVGVVVEKTL